MLYEQLSHQVGGHQLVAHAGQGWVAVDEGVALRGLGGSDASVIAIAEDYKSHNLDAVLDGDLEELVDALVAADRAESIAGRPARTPLRLGVRCPVHDRAREQDVNLQLTTARTRHRNPRTAMRYLKSNAVAVAEATELLDVAPARGG